MDDCNAIGRLFAAR